MQITNYTPNAWLKVVYYINEHKIKISKIYNKIGMIFK